MYAYGYTDSALNIPSSKFDEIKPIIMERIHSKSYYVSVAIYLDNSGLNGGYVINIEWCLTYKRNKIPMGFMNYTHDLLLANLDSIRAKSLRSNRWMVGR